MDVSKRVKGIMLAPETEWSEIEKEPGTPAWLFTNYVVYLAAIPPIAGFIGGSLIGITVPPSKVATVEAVSTTASRKTSALQSCASLAPSRNARRPSIEPS